MDRFEFYKTLYLEELKRKEELRTALTLPAGILTILGGVVAVYSRELGKVEAIDTAAAFLGIGVLLLIASFTITLSSLIKSYHNYEYDFVPYAIDLESAYQELVEYYQSTGQGVEEADHDFKISLMESLITAHQKNSYNNDSKSSHLHNANQTLIYCLSLALLCAVPYFFRTLNAPTDVQKVEIVNPEDIPVRTDGNR